MATSKRQRRTVGSIVQVPLGDGTYCYAQVLQEADFAFFDIRAAGSVDVADIVTRPVLFRIAVMNHAITSGRWQKVGSAPLSADLAGAQPKFIQDALDPARFEIYLAGHTRPATREECRGLERSAVWEPEHVEDRLRDHYAGRPNKWVKSLALR